MSVGPDLDWQKPWYLPYARLGRQLGSMCNKANTLRQVAQSLNAIAGAALPLRFVPQSCLPPHQAYEAFIHTHKQVPTRDNAHDFFNGLIWLHFPQAKMRLNAIQAAQIEGMGVQKHRGPVRDGATIFDENAALLQAPPALWQALRQRCWTELFGPLRRQWQQARLLIFGHAALEKLMHPYKSVTVHVWQVCEALNMLDLPRLDAWLATDLSAEKLAQKPFAPLPVLGIPGWWPDNEDAGFYQDKHVFR